MPTTPASLLRSFLLGCAFAGGGLRPCLSIAGWRSGPVSWQRSEGFRSEAQDPRRRKDLASFAQILHPAPCVLPWRPHPTYLHSGLREPDTQRQLLAHEDVGVVSLGEAPLQFVELRRSEARPVALLLLLALLLAGLAGVRAALWPRLLVRVLCTHRQ